MYGTLSDVNTLNGHFTGLGKFVVAENKISQAQSDVRTL